MNLKNHHHLVQRFIKKTIRIYEFLGNPIILHPRWLATFLPVVSYFKNLHLPEGDSPKNVVFVLRTSHDFPEKKQVYKIVESA